MPRDGVTMKLDGAAEIQKLFRETPKAILEKGIKSAATGSMRPVSTAAKRVLRSNRGDMPWSTGLLEKSIGVKTKVYKRGRNSGMVWVGVGPRSGFKGIAIRPVISGKGDGVRTSLGSVDARFANPTQYAHLVEFGARVRGRQTRATPFMRKAYASKGRAAPAAMARKLRLLIPKIIKREAQRARTKRR